MYINEIMEEQLMPVVIKYYTIDQLKEIYDSKKSEIMNKYNHQKELIKRQNITDSVRKAKLTRLTNNINDQLSQVESRYGSIANGAEDIILNSKLKEMYELYTNNKFTLDNVRTRRDLTEFYIDVDERKRIWVSYVSQYKYKCTLDNKCMGKGTRYQMKPLITFEDYNGHQIS